MGNVFIFLLGWASGALVNYLADVLPLRLRLAPPFCQACNASQPLFSYLVWPRRCPVCGQRRAWRVWIVEATAIVVTFWLWQSPPMRLGFSLGLGVLIYFGLVAVIDLEYRLILLPLSLAGACLGLGTGIWLQWQRTGHLGQALVYTLFGGVAGFFVMLLFYYLGGIFARWIARRRSEGLEEEALGFGDVHLGLILGLFLGWPVIFIGLMAGVVFGGCASLVYLIARVIFGRHRWFAVIPYGPYLIAGAIFLLYFRDYLFTTFAR